MNALSLDKHPQEMMMCDVRHQLVHCYLCPHAHLCIWICFAPALGSRYILF